MVDIIDTLKAKGSGILLPCISLLLVTYFALHLMHGARGLHVYFDLKDKIIAAEEQLKTVNAEHDRLDARVARISPGSLDADLIDELARKNLGLSQTDERTIFIGRPEKKIGETNKKIILVPGAGGK